MTGRSMNREIRLFETPDGVITDDDRGRRRITAVPSYTPGLVHIRIDISRPNGAKYFQIIEPDADMARLFAAKLQRAADEADAAAAKAAQGQEQGQASAEDDAGDAP